METIIAAVTTGLLALIGTVFALRKESKAEAAADWARFSESQREWTEHQLKVRDDVIADMRKRLGELEKRVAEITEKYSAARGYIVSLWAGHAHPPAPPATIAPDLPSMPEK